MNIQNEALKLVLENPLTEVPVQYFSEDYQQIVLKAKAFFNKRGEMPSLTFLFNNSKKLSDDKEQVGRIEDILYAMEKYKPELTSPMEINELLLEDYKKDNIRKLTKSLAQAQAEDNWVLAGKYSREIGEISKLELIGNNFLQDDDKEAFTKTSAKIQKISSGLLTHEKLPISETVVGSNIIYAAPSGMGKTILGITTFMNCYLSGQNVLMISYEISKSQIFLRMKSIMTGVPLREIADEDYVLEESKVAVLCSNYVILKQISFKDAVKLYNKSGEEALKELPDRTNSMKIIAAVGKEEMEYARQHGKPIESLPTDEEIINILNEYGEELDSVIIDYISEVPFSNKNASREIAITNFTRELKLLALEKGFNNYILSQVAGENDAYNIFQTKYALSLINVADTALFLVATKEMKSAGYVALAVRKARHFKTSECYLCSIDYETQRLEYLGENISMADLQDEFKNDFKEKKK